MIQNIFQYDNVNGKVELNVPEILLVREFAELMKNERNISDKDPKGEYKLRAFREFTYIWLAIDWKSVYADYSELERHLESLKDAGITESEWNNPEFRAACRKYREIQESNRSIKMLNAALNMADKITDYLNNLDPEERDPLTGKYLNKVKDVLTEMKNLMDVHETLIALENLVKKLISEQTNIRAGARNGYRPKS